MEYLFKELRVEKVLRIFKEMSELCITIDVESFKKEDIQMTINRSHLQKEEAFCLNYGS